MKVISTFFLILAANILLAQNIDHEKRLEYLKSHHLFVVKVQFDHKMVGKNISGSINENERVINRNIKKCLDTFWDLNDSIFYIETKEFKYYKKKFPNDLFLNYIFGDFYSFNLIIPESNISLNDISPRLFVGDTTLLSITQELRQLQYNVIHGNTKYKGVNEVKIILILDEPAENDYHQQFIDKYKAKYPDNFQVVDRQFINSAIYLRDPRFIYIYRLSIINCADGSMIQI
jgi:hypothetical protein